MSSIALVSFMMGLAMAPAQESAEECMLLMVLDGMRSLESALWNGLLAPDGSLWKDPGAASSAC